MKQRLVLIVCAGAGFLALPSALHAWGCEGHQIVATIAAGQLTAHARAEVNALLKSNPIDPSLKRFCKASGLTNMQDGATWADDVKKSNGTDTEHFVDIPRTDTSGDVAAACPGGKCVTEAMKRNLDKLKSGTTSDREKADALRQRGVDDEMIAERLEAEHRAHEQERRARRPRLRAAGGRVLNRVLRCRALVAAERLR